MSLEKIFCIILFPFLLLSSCTPAAKDADKLKEIPIFSVRQFALDQREVLMGQPLVLEKKAILNGTMDSSLVPIENVDWGAVFKVFFDTDISNQKFTDQYDFSMFDNNTTASTVMYYQAKNPKLFTRVLEVNIDPFSHMIRSIYIETAQNSFWNDKSQKLFYAPRKTLQIQETEKPLMGSKKELRITYKFL